MQCNLLLIVFIALTTATSAQVKVTGRVTNLKNLPVSDVIVKCICDNNTLAFTTSNAQGVYTLELKETPKKEVVLLFNHISYEKEEVKTVLKDKITKQDMAITEKSISLKEVKVNAPPFTLLGDTLTYNLASFLKKGDVTLEDGLKNLPGITIAENGAISYMGKDISNFYIGSIDMLGGRYNLATKNIPAEYATQVEIMKHHKHRKIDADEESDAVAINVKLSNKAKFKPFGQPEFGVGYRKQESLYAAGATEMMFTDNFQLLASAKYSNNGSFGLYDMVNHDGSDNFGSLATAKLPAWGQAYSSVGEAVYQTNGYGSLNAIQKLDSVRQIRVNADYIYDRMTSSSCSDAYYFAGGENIYISESVNPLAKAHRPMFSLKFENNASNHYFSDSFNVKAQFLSNENDVYSCSATGGLLATQHRKSTSINLHNNFWRTIRLGKKKISFTSDVSITRTPSVMMTMNDIAQSGQSSQVSTRHGTSLQIKLSGKWKIDTPITLEANYNFIETELITPEHDDQRLRMNGWKLVPTINPSTSWTSANKKFYASMGMNLRRLNLSYLSQLDNKRTTLSQLFAEPHASMRYTFSGTSELNFSSGFNHSTGDIMDLLTIPVQTDYRNTSVASGVIGKSQSWNTSLRYSKQIPFSYFTFGANTSYSQSKRNVLSSRNVSPTTTENMSIFRDSHSRSASAGINASKNILSLFTKFSGNASVSWSSSEYMMQNEFVTSYHTGCNLYLQVDITPIPWLEVNAKGNYGKDFSRTKSSNLSSDNLRCTGSVAVFPISSFEIRSTCSFMHNMVEPGKYKDASMLSASVLYKAKRAVWKLTGENLLDVRQYTRTSFVDTDRFVHTTNLIGRTLILTYKHLLAGKK